MKCATRETIAAQITPAVPPIQKNGSTGIIAPIPVLRPAATAAWPGFPPALTPPSSSVTSACNMASGWLPSRTASSSAWALPSPLSW